MRGVEQQGKNRFKLTYVHPEKEDMDLVIVVEMRERKSKMKLVNSNGVSSTLKSEDSGGG
ncbi:hypothetical protein [Pyrococcus kukulkanii]|uniref:hypothetical protein n=1 Tax=Pyrococcus kukulkanii TaxID=1609559 RepID=UPI003564EE45